MTREVVCEYATRSFGTNFGYTGELISEASFRARFRKMHGPWEIEVISSEDHQKWTIAALSDAGGEFARLRGRNWFFEPLASMQVLLPRQQGLRLRSNAVLPLGFLIPKTAYVPAPFDRRVRFGSSPTGMIARWPACGGGRNDEILMALVAFRFWLQIERETSTSV